MKHLSVKHLETKATDGSCYAPFAPHWTSTRSIVRAADKSRSKCNANKPDDAERKQDFIFLGEWKWKLAWWQAADVPCMVLMWLVAQLIKGVIPVVHDSGELGWHDATDAYKLESCKETESEESKYTFYWPGYPGGVLV